MKKPNAAFGQIYGNIETPAFITDSGIPVWMWRKGQHVRFYSNSGEQIGPEQRNVAPAVCFALANGWMEAA